MAERCPLLTGIYWQNEETRPFPEICQQVCADLIEDALEGVPVNTDVFDPTAQDTEYADTSLQRLAGASRQVAILSISVETGDDVQAEEYIFECPNN